MISYGAWRDAVLAGSETKLVRETLESGGFVRLSGMPAAVSAAADGTNESLEPEKKRLLLSLDLEGWEPSEGDLQSFARYRAARVDEEPDARTLTLAEGRGLFRAAQVSLAASGSLPAEKSTTSTDDAAAFESWLRSFSAQHRLAVVTAEGDLLPQPLRRALKSASDSGSIAWIEGSPSRSAATLGASLDDTAAEALDKALRPPGDSGDEDSTTTTPESSSPEASAHEAPAPETSAPEPHRLLAERAAHALMLLNAPVSLDLLIAGLSSGEVGRFDPEEVVDTVDDFYTDELGLLEDLGFLHPAFEDSVYRAADPAAVHRWRTTQGEEGLQELAGFWLGWLRRALPAQKRATSGLLLRLSDLAFGSEDPRGLHVRRRLRWWTEDVESLEIEARLQLEEGTLAEHDLAEIASDQVLPAAVRLLFLDLQSERGVPEKQEGAHLMDRALALAEAGRHDEALKAARAGARWHEEHVSEDSERHHATKWLLAHLLGGAGQLQEARAELEEVSRMAAELFEETDPRRGGAAAALGEITLKLGELRNAVEPMREAERLAELALGGAHPTTLVRRNNLATLLIDVGELETARDLLRRAVADAELGRQNRQIGFPLFHNLQALSLRLSPNDRGELESLLAESRRLFGDHANQVPLLSRLAELLRRDGEVERAEALEKHAQELAATQRMPGLDAGIAELLEASGLHAEEGRNPAG